ncbi:hypothetical protein E2562_012881 [Oryza meyeriana var. granulata]|uniref:Uncharacterized protein n=1 Tax=Oryza meyeriana var. granulata TaxID=110450 RepID=A0A6G1CR20_9ORYZ|nr:hypothetical protein E2562_012881 [Oryza meyeriana var. granulata]
MPDLRPPLPNPAVRRRRGCPPARGQRHPYHGDGGGKGALPSSQTTAASGLTPGLRSVAAMGLLPGSGTAASLAC